MFLIELLKNYQINFFHSARGICYLAIGPNPWFKKAELWHLFHFGVSKTNFNR